VLRTSSRERFPQIEDLCHFNMPIGATALLFDHVNEVGSLAGNFEIPKVLKTQDLEHPKFPYIRSDHSSPKKVGDSDT
jgi:hypothetical protein